MDPMCVLLGQRECAASKIMGRVQGGTFTAFELTLALDRNGRPGPRASRMNGIHFDSQLFLVIFLRKHTKTGCG